MKRKAVSGILVTLLLMSFLILIFNIQPVEALTTPLINPVPEQYANYTMYFQNGTAYGSCLTTYQNYYTSILVNVSIEQQIKNNYWDSWYLVNIMNRQQHFISMRNYSREQLEFEDIDVFWSFWIETDIKLDDEITLEGSLSKVVDSGIIDAAGFTREYWLLESDPYMNLTFLWGFDKETGILIYLKSLHPEGETNFMLTSTNIFTRTPAEFTFSDLSQFISIEEGADIAIFVNVSNVGDIEGTHQVDLKLEGGDILFYTVYSINVTLLGGASEEVPLWIEGGLNVGTYQVEVEGLTGSFTVVKTEPSFWDNIPGFPYESIIIGLMAVIIILWRSRKF